MPRAGGTNGPRYTLRGAHGESIEGCRSTSLLARHAMTERLAFSRTFVTSMISGLLDIFHFMNTPIPAPVDGKALDALLKLS